MKKLVIEYWTPVVLWLINIFNFSTDTFAKSSTSGLIVPVLSFLFPWLSPQQLDVLHEVIRKLGHITEYFILALFTYRIVMKDQSDPTAAKLRTFSVIVLAAMVDELHQRFTLFRNASPIDVGYDSFGAVGALWLITLYETRRLRTHTVL